MTEIVYIVFHKVGIQINKNFDFDQFYFQPGVSTWLMLHQFLSVGNKKNKDLSIGNNKIEDLSCVGRTVPKVI